MVEAAVAAVGVAADQVHVQPLQVGRRQRGAGQQAALQVGELARQALDDAVGVGLAQRGRPASGLGNLDLAEYDLPAANEQSAGNS